MVARAWSRSGFAQGLFSSKGHKMGRSRANETERGHPRFDLARAGLVCRRRLATPAL